MAELLFGYDVPAFSPTELDLLAQNKKLTLWMDGTDRNWEELANAWDVNGKLPILAWTDNTTTVTFVIDKIHGTYATPLTGNITADTTWAVNGVTNDMFHRDVTAPTYTGVTSVNGTYTTGSVNMLSFQYKWGAVILFIQTLA